MYDLIGDIHGFAAPLKQLLAKLGYSEDNGLWTHPQRQVIFLGDFVDRGPGQVETVVIARTMVEAGAALAVMGNHEFNAVAWTMADPLHPGQYLRSRNRRNRDQHEAFLTQVGEGSAMHADIIEWFKTLPLYLDLPGLRVVHACWHPVHLQTLGSYTDGHNRILDDAWPQLTRYGTAPFDALETVLKGLEIPLPAGSEFVDGYGHIRRNIRAQWWDLDGITYRDLAMVPADAIPNIPHQPIPEDLLPGYAGDKPLFVGHYWMTGDPAPLNDHIACLDYSIAAKNGNGKLCAYRWDGEQVLRRENFVWVAG